MKVRSYKYLIVGAGVSADAAAKGIRELDANGSIGIIGQEPYAPYARCPMSKQLWSGKPESIIWCRTGERGVNLHTGRKVVALDIASHEVTDEAGVIYRYERLLLATGGSPRRLPFGGDDIIYFRTLDDYRRLRALAEKGGPFAVIGGGFVGSEIAAALAKNGHETYMIFPESGISGLVFPHDLSDSVTNRFRAEMIRVLTGEIVADLRLDGDSYILTTGKGNELKARGVVAGLGITPNVELATHAGLAVENGITVDEFLRAGDPDVFAAGDVANFYNPLLGKRIRVEHKNNALTMGKQAGRNMAGAGESYHHLPFFYSDLFDMRYEAVGELDNRLETVSDWREPYKKGVVYYLRDGRVRGVLLWNVRAQIELARSLLAEAGPFSPSNLMGRLPA